MMSEALDSGLAEVRLWGEGCPGGLDEEASLVWHRLSFAARAFKAQAPAAAAVPGEGSEDTEEFRRAARRRAWSWPGSSDDYRLLSRRRGQA